MSLNGLDDVKVKEAHDAAVAEPGGWFLLKYASRDAVELMGRGNGGIVEIRNAIAQHTEDEEESPLFGFLRYRRRNVVIKYVPESCSRLVQARVTVHFNAVTERFSPHDTVFPITTPKELRDTTLSAACSLHTASGSTSSSTSSLRRRRLMEIAEEAEEENRAKRQSTVPEERPSTAKTASVSGSQSPLPPTSSPHVLPTGLPESSDYRSLIAETETSPPPPRSRLSVDEPRRLSSQSVRPELYNYTTYGSNGKPKVKLGPRPSLDVGGRPYTSGASSHYRPVSTLPAGLKLFSKGPKKARQRPQSQHPQSAPIMTLSPPIPDTMPLIPPVPPSRPHTSGGRPSTSPNTQTTPLISPIDTAKQPTMTPEKARLMKALQLRKKNLSSTPMPEQTPPTAHEGSQMLPATTSGTSLTAPQEVNDTLAMLNDIKTDDSGIAFDAASAPRTDESDATRSDSYPVSPVGHSEKAESTRASSISESTDETVQAANVARDSPKDMDDYSDQKNIFVLDHAPQETLVDMKIEDSGESYSKPAVKRLPEENHAPREVGQVVQIVVQPTDEPLGELPHYSSQHIPSQLSPAKNETPQETESSNVHEQAVPIEVTAEEASIPVDVQSLVPEGNLSEAEPATIPMPKEKPNAEVEAAPVPETSPKAEFQEWQVPRSKFSVENLKTPRSRFSTQDPKAPDSVPAVPKIPLAISVSQATVDSEPKSPVGSTFSAETKISLVEDGQENDFTIRKRRKRKGLVEPIRTDFDSTDKSTANSEANFSSDDDLMDELQSAVFQEAKPISVSKSPISPVFPNSAKKVDEEDNRFTRAFSNPLGKDGSKQDLLTPPMVPRADPARSVSASAAYLNRISSQPTVPIAKKVNLGSGISQRIKALEKLSSLGPGSTQTSGSRGPSPGASPAFFSVHKTSRSPSIAERANSLTKRTPSPNNSRESSPETFKLRERSGSIQSRVDAFKAPNVPTTETYRPRTETISVTARIIRDPSLPFPQKSEAGKDPSDYTPLHLKQSPLVIDHQKPTAILTKDPPRETIQERRLSNASKPVVKERRSSITIVKDLISDRRNSFAERRRSVNLERSPNKDAPIKSPRPPSVHSTSGFHLSMSFGSRPSTSHNDHASIRSPPPTAGSFSSNSEEKSEKKSNRASRMLRRMSSSISAGRKNIAHAISPTVREESEPLPHSINSKSLTPSVPTPTTMDIEDVNVQFPDTLLWKRRSMALDSQGFLILSPALTAHEHTKDKANLGATRRFHLSEFRTPVIPEMEMQELPNSVVLDFIEGGGLQVACEDRAGQWRVLNVLQEAHRSWGSYDQ